MFHLLGIFSILYVCVQATKEAFTPTIPAENWANKDLYHKDLMSGMDSKQLMKNVEKGKYKLPVQNYPEPHRDPVSGKIVIENCTLYEKDVKEYGAHQAYQWVKQGRYNLTPEELEEERRKLKEELGYL